jgi:L-ornithine N5-oxygenase
VSGDLEQIYDVVGIGFGPSNLALSIAIDEHRREHPDLHFKVASLERQSTFGWHRGMLIDGATMQVSFLKDLVSMRRPTSDFTFLSYLQERGRLSDFVNHKSFFPTRVEFHDYFEWVAARLSGYVQYGIEVTEVRPVERDGRVLELEVVGVRAGDPAVKVVRRARNVVLGPGLTPRMPAGVSPGARVWHNRNLLFDMESSIATDARRFIVIGAGQSAAETVEHLHRTRPSAEVIAIFSRYGYSPADDSPWANRIFDPEAVDVYFSADSDTRDRLMRYHANTNYGVVDLDLIEELYRRSYQEKVRGRERLKVMNVSAVRGIVEHEDRVELSVLDLATGGHEQVVADVVVCATGYVSADLSGILGKLEPYLNRDVQGRYAVERDYRIDSSAALQAGVYLQGGTEHTHGISSSLLSMVAVRAGEILKSLLQNRSAQADFASVAMPTVEPFLGRPA